MKSARPRSFVTQCILALGLLVLLPERTSAQFMELRSPFERFTDWRVIVSASVSTPPNSQWDEGIHASLPSTKKQININQIVSIEYGEFRVGFNLYSVPSSMWPFVFWNPKFSLYGWDVGGDSNRWALSVRGENLFASKTGNEFLGRGQSDKSNHPDRNSISFLLTYWMGSKPDTSELKRLYQEQQGYTSLQEDVLASIANQEVRFSTRDGLSLGIGLGTGKYAGTGPLSRHINFLSSYDVAKQEGFSGISPLLLARYRLRNLIAQLDIAGEDINLHFVLRNLKRLDIETGIIHLEHLFPRSTRGPHRPEAYLSLRYAVLNADTSDLEASYFEYGDKVLDRNLDNDADGLNDGDELLTYNTDPTKRDTDADGLHDGEEIKVRKTDPQKPDTDGDGLEDGDEVNKFRTSPRVSDTDGDGLTDGEEHIKYLTDKLNRDSDGDGITDGDEVKRDINPLSRDSDGDGLSDGDEVVVHRTSPRLADTDGDELGDYKEVNDTKTNPLSTDTDEDGVKDGEDDCPLVPGDVVKKGCPESLPKGQSLDVAGIEFELNKSVILEVSLPSLLKADTILRAYPNIRVSIEGHTDNTGDPDFNKRLSLERAQAVRKWLVDRGISANRLEVRGWGQDRPATTNATEEGRARNRRMEFIVIEE